MPNTRGLDDRTREILDELCAFSCHNAYPERVNRFLSGEFTISKLLRASMWWKAGWARPYRSTPSAWRKP
jgi:hypothetical protein